VPASDAERVAGLCFARIENAIFSRFLKYCPVPVGPTKRGKGTKISAGCQRKMVDLCSTADAGESKDCLPGSIIFRRLVIHSGYHVENFFGGCLRILLRRL
jgi:hypothetical protein